MYKALSNMTKTEKKHLVKYIADKMLSDLFAYAHIYNAEHCVVYSVFDMDWIQEVLIQYSIKHLLKVDDFEYVDIFKIEYISELLDDYFENKTIEKPEYLICNFNIIRNKRLFLVYQIGQR